MASEYADGLDQDLSLVTIIPDAEHDGWDVLSEPFPFGIADLLGRILEGCEQTVLAPEKRM